MQRKCKSNAEYQACLNIMLRCSLSYAKIMNILEIKQENKKSHDDMANI